MQSHHETSIDPEAGWGYCCDNHDRRTHHGTEQRYISPTSGQCRKLVVQAVQPNRGNRHWTEISVGDNPYRVKKLAIWLVTNPPRKLGEVPLWSRNWAWFTLCLIWPFSDLPSHTGLYPGYFSKYRGQLWAARSPREYSLRNPKQVAERINEITHGTHPRRLFIRDPPSTSWTICSDPNIIKQQSYVAVSYASEYIFPRDVDNESRLGLENAFIARVEAIMVSLNVSAYWIDLKLVEKRTSRDLEKVNEDVYRMADVYRGAQFTLIVLDPPAEVSDTLAWTTYGERLWTFPEALLGRELRFKFRDGNVTPITLHELANRAYPHFSEESAIVNSYGLRDPLERLERLSLLRSALWQRTSSDLQRPVTDQEGRILFQAERVYALMGFFEHRIVPHPLETEIQALVRLSMANDNDRIVERMVSLLPHPSQDRRTTPYWFAEDDQWDSDLWHIEPDIQVVGLTASNALVLGGCLAAAIRWKDFPSVAFATRRSVKRLIATFLPSLFPGVLLIGIVLVGAASGHGPPPAGGVAILIIGLTLTLVAPLLVAYGTSGRIMQAQPWLIGVKGLISADEASDLLYGGTISKKFTRTFYSASGTPLSLTEKQEVRRGDPQQLADLIENGGDDLYTLIDTVSATVYYFRAERPPTICLYTGRESGMGRFLLCSEKCKVNELHKETVIRMPWYISKSMRACDWVALD